MTRLVVDTDLGTDVDDALALAVLLGSPSVALELVTTVYGDTVLRGRMAGQLFRRAGTPVPVVAGAATPLSGKAVWLSGQEEAGWAALPLEEPPGGGEDEDDGARALVAAAAAAPGEVEVLAIGPLTNLARALRLSPAFAEDVKRVWVMGGRFDEAGPEHNFASDAVAAAEVLASPLPLTVMGLEITRRVHLVEEDVISFAGGPLGDLLVAQTRAWMRYWDEPYDVPHDALTALAPLEPTLFRSTPGAFRADTVTGTASFTPGPPGRQELVTGVDVDAARIQILTRIRRAAAAAPDPRPEEAGPRA